MLGKMRPLALSLVLAAAAFLPASGRSEDPKAAKLPADKPHRSTPVELGEEEAATLVPLHPRSAEDRDRLDALQGFVESRALEDQGRRREAITRLEDALKKDPESVAILRRLSRLSLALNRTQKGLEYARRVLDVEPGDTETLSRLMDHYERTDDPAGAEALLRKLLENPKLDKSSAGYLLIERDLGLLYADRLNQPEKAADALAKVAAALDEKSANRLSLPEQKLILGDEESETYAKFGEVFSKVKRYDLAITAFRRGLVYAPEDTQLPRLLAEAMLRAGRGAEALAVLEPFLRRQPQGREPYELLAEILTALKRGGEILPRLEAAAKADAKNSGLQYFLADRYRDAGQAEKAETLYRTLLATQPDPQGIGSLTGTLLKEKKYDQLIKVLGDAFTKPETLEAVKPQIESIANSPETTDALLDAGIKLQEATPPQLSRESRLILSYIATKGKRFDRLVKLQRLVVKQNPEPQAYHEFCVDLMRLGRYAEATAAVEELLQKFPDQRKNEEILRVLSQTRMLAGNNEGAIEAAREVLKLAPNDVLSQLFIGSALGRMGKNDEAIAHYKAMLEKVPANNDEVIRRIRSGLSVIYVNMERFDEGERELEILYEKDPEDAGVNNDLGYLYAERGKNLDKAEAMIRKAVEEEPDNASYLDSLGWVYFKQGKLKEALGPLEKAAKDTSADPTIHDHLGDVYFKLQELTKAKAEWRAAEEAAAKVNPPDKRLAEIRKKLESLGKLEGAPAAAGSSNP